MRVSLESGVTFDLFFFYTLMKNLIVLSLLSSRKHRIFEKRVNIANINEPRSKVIFPSCFDINYSFKLLLHIYFRYSFSPSFFLGYIRINKIITTFPRRHDSKIVPYVLI